eukprot:8406187-Lingulodinium_polyedra.AAC.1
MRSVATLVLSSHAAAPSTEPHGTPRQCALNVMCRYDSGCGSATCRRIGSVSTRRSRTGWSPRLASR